MKDKNYNRLIVIRRYSRRKLCDYIKMFIVVYKNDDELNKKVKEGLRKKHIRNHGDFILVYFIGDIIGIYRYSDGLPLGDLFFPYRLHVHDIEESIILDKKEFAEIFDYFGFLNLLEIAYTL